jgi:hypothetical protein
VTRRWLVLLCSVSFWRPLLLFIVFLITVSCVITNLLEKRKRRVKCGEEIEGNIEWGSFPFQSVPTHQLGYLLMQGYTTQKNNAWAATANNSISKSSISYFLSSFFVSSVFILIPRLFWRRGSSVSIVSGYGLGDRGSIPGRGKRIFPLTSVSRPALGPTQPYVQWVLSTKVKHGRGVTLTTGPI